MDIIKYIFSSIIDFVLTMLKNTDWKEFFALPLVRGYIILHIIVGAYGFFQSFFYHQMLDKQQRLKYGESVYDKPRRQNYQ